MTSPYRKHQNTIMSSQRKRVVDCASVGEPPKKNVGCIETVKFVIYDFQEKFEEEKGNIRSPKLKAHGCLWTITCYRSITDDNTFDCHFGYFGNGSTTVSYTIRCKHRSVQVSTHTFTPGYIGHGRTLFHRSQIEEYLEDDGSLVIEVDVQRAVAVNGVGVWYSQNLHQQDFLVDLYQGASSETADVVFSIGKTEYSAHKNVLRLRCKKLFEIAEESDHDAPIAIPSTREDVFKALLDFVYTVKLPDVENKDMAMELLSAADCYECIDLKLYVESVIVEKVINPENAAELLVFADSYSCPLLKEKATTIFITDTATVKNTEAWSKVKESNRLLVELIDALTNSGKPEEDDRKDKDLERLDVTALRNILQEKKLELDGSREVLVQRLKKFDEQLEEDNGSNDDDGDEEADKIPRLARRRRRGILILRP